MVKLLKSQPVDSEVIIIFKETLVIKSYKCGIKHCNGIASQLKDNISIVVIYS